MSSEVIAALLGAVAAGLLQTLVNVAQRRHEAGASLVAIASEVAAICVNLDNHLIREHVARQGAALREGSWDGRGVIVDITQDYFTVYNANASNLGKLSKLQAATIVRFYNDCKSLLDSTRPGGLVSQSKDPEFVAANFAYVERLLTEVFLLGARIASMPQVALPTPWMRDV